MLLHYKSHEKQAKDNLLFPIPSTIGEKCWNSLCPYPCKIWYDAQRQNNKII